MPDTGAPQISLQDGVTIISLGPEYENLDDDTMEDLKLAILNASTEADPPLVVLDLSHTKFFGSAFIEILFRVWNRMNSVPGGQFVISNLNSYCREVIQVTHLDKLWSIYPTREDAIRDLNSGNAPADD